MTRIVVNHLTRMREGGRICIAGIETESETHLRPVTGPERPLTRRLLVEQGGAFELGAVVDLGAVDPRPAPPHVEDCLFDPTAAKQVGKLDGDEYLDLIDRISSDDMEEAFGSALRRPTKWKYAVDLGEGERSLACVRVRRKPDIEIDEYEKVTLRFNDPDMPAFLRVSDLRFYLDDQETPDREAVADARSRFRRGVRTWIAFGLARAFPAAGDDTKRNWLQVNGICLEDSPLDGFP